jgi:hypothetical protein
MANAIIYLYSLGFITLGAAFVAACFVAGLAAVRYALLQARTWQRAAELEAAHRSDEHATWLALRTGAYRDRIAADEAGDDAQGGAQ